MLARIDRFSSCPISNRSESTDAIIASEPEWLSATGLDDLKLPEWGHIRVPGTESFHIHHRHRGRGSGQLIVEFSKHEPGLSKYTDVGLSR